MPKEPDTKPQCHGPCQTAPIEKTSSRILRLPLLNFPWAESVVFKISKSCNSCQNQLFCRFRCRFGNPSHAFNNRSFHRGSIFFIYIYSLVFELLLIRVSTLISFSKIRLSCRRPAPISPFPSGLQRFVRSSFCRDRRHSLSHPSYRADSRV